METPGETIRHNKRSMEEFAIAMVDRFEDATDVKVQSVHYYLTDPDPNLLNDKPKQRVDIILKL